MEQESPSFWVEIKKYEDMLARDPNSYCFAPLAELYRKLGMLDDAINIAQRGCEIHPEYVGGYMALGRAYFEKGMKSESRTALEKVVRVTPDNLLAQRLLTQIYIDAGDVAAAEKSLKIILVQNPGDMESQVLLNSLPRIAGDQPSAVDMPPRENVAGAGMVAEPDDSLELEDAEILEELEEAEEGEDEEFIYPVQPRATVPDSLIPGELEGKDPLNTVTLAELYISQGFLKRALTIYRELVMADPDNLELKRRLVELKHEIDQDDASAREHSLEFDASGARDEETSEPLDDFFMPVGTESDSAADAEELEPASETVATDGFAEELEIFSREAALSAEEPYAEVSLPPGTEGGSNAGVEPEPEQAAGMAGGERYAEQATDAFDTSEVLFENDFLTVTTGNGDAPVEEPARAREAGVAITSQYAEPEAVRTGVGEFAVATAFVDANPLAAEADGYPVDEALRPEGASASTGENVVHTLERWLENIRRRRS